MPVYFGKCTPKQRWAQKRNWMLLRLRGIYYNTKYIKDETVLCPKAQAELNLAITHLKDALEAFERQRLDTSFELWAAKEGIKIPKSKDLNKKV